MNINATTLDRLAGPQAPNVSRAGDGGFQALYERATGESSSVAREGVAVYQAASTVRAGDTLHGIVRARLAKMGVDVTSKVAMEGVKQVAQANNIRNPNRIYVGQKLDLAGLASRFGPSQTVPVARSIDSSITTAGGIEHLRHLRREEPAPEADAQVAAEEAADLPSPVAGMPPDDPAAEVHASRQVAIYEQTASLAPEKPAEPASALPDILYKGVVGKVLDAMPIEPGTRTALQKANTVVSGTLTVRSLGALAGFGGPLLTVAGLIWGIFSSRQIDPAAAGVAKATGETKTADAPKPAGDAVRVAQNQPSEPLH
jgi:hypothetical protein